MSHQTGLSRGFGRLALIPLVLAAFLLASSASFAGVIYLDEGFEGAAIFKDQHFPVVGDSSQPTTAGLRSGINLRSFDMETTVPVVVIGRQEGVVDSSRAFQGAKCYRLDGGNGLAVTPGNFPYRDGGGSRCWQFAISTSAAQAARTAGSTIGHFRIAYALDGTASTSPGTTITMNLVAAGGGKANLVCANNGAVVGSVSGASDDWLLVTVIAMHRLNKTSMSDTITPDITYDPLTDSFKGPQPGLITGVHIFGFDQKTGERSRTALRRGAGLPTAWGNADDHGKTCELGWEFEADPDGLLYIDNFYWDARLHNSPNGGFDNERGARLEPFRTGTVLGNLFTDNAVLQRDMPVPVFGTADAGDAIMVKFRGQQKSTTADRYGKWSVVLDAMPAGGPFNLDVLNGATTTTAHNVMVGEVWVCSGQSNMDFNTGSALNGPAEVAAANHPNIRLLHVPAWLASRPADYAGGNWMVCSPATAQDFSAVGYFFARDLQSSLTLSRDTPVGIIQASFGGTVAESWTSVEALGEQFDLNGPDLGLSWGAIGIGQLFNAEIYPLTRYAARGANWYQGESNANRGTIYQKLLTCLINDWRAHWGRQDFAFQIVQLPNIAGDWGGGPWPITREAELLISQSVPETSLAVTIDVGEADNVHPLNKQAVGDRLARAALAKFYGGSNEYSGPSYREATIEGNKMRIAFDHVGGGLVDGDGGNLLGFGIAGLNGIYTTSTAVATFDGNDVLVSSPNVANPVKVNYAWADDPNHDLYNKVGLPASPFRTDYPGAPEFVAPIPTNITRSGYSVGILAAGKKTYTDRTSVFEEFLPAGMAGRTYILTKNADKDTTGTDFLRFYLSQPASVFVALDARFSHAPSWMSGWTGLPYSYSLGVTGGERRLWVKRFATGTVILGANRDSSLPTGMNMYSVIIAPDKTGVEDWRSYR